MSLRSAERIKDVCQRPLLCIIQRFRGDVGVKISKKLKVASPLMWKTGTIGFYRIGLTSAPELCRIGKDLTQPGH